MDGDNEYAMVSESADRIQGLTSHIAHKGTRGIGKICQIFLYHLTQHYHALNVIGEDIAFRHPLVRMRFQGICSLADECADLLSISVRHAVSIGRDEL